MEGFPTISNLAVTTQIIPERIFFSSGSLNRKSVLSLHLDLKIIFSLQCGKSLSIVRLGLVLKSSESLPKYRKAKFNYFRNHEIKVFL